MVMGEFTQEVDLLVIGGGPGGYASAFRAADLGLDVAMVDLGPRPGGVCLFRGCIPSKTLLYLTELMHDANRSANFGVTFCPPELDLPKLRAWKDSVTDKLSGGLMTLSKKRGVQFVQARAVFEGSNLVRLHGAEISHFRFRHAILATGSTPRPLPGLEFREGGRVMDSTGALALAEIPESLLVVGGGFVGLELGSVYAALGSKVTLVERGDRLIPGADPDLARPLIRRVQKDFEAIYTDTGIVEVKELDDRVEVVLEGKKVKQARHSFDRALVAIGRTPNSHGIGLETTQVQLDKRGFVMVDMQQRTADPAILAIGDVVGGVMLAHKAMREGKVAAEVIAGGPAAFDAHAIPSVVYTDPQLAWAGLTEQEAAEQGIEVKIGRFPWGASGRAVSMDAPEGMTKIVVDAETQRVLGFGIVGRNAGEMISEGTLAVEMGALAQDLALTIHPHPTLSETEGEAAEAFLGSATHILPQRS